MADPAAAAAAAALTSVALLLDELHDALDAVAAGVGTGGGGSGVELDSTVAGLCAAVAACTAAGDGGDGSDGGDSLRRLAALLCDRGAAAPRGAAISRWAPRPAGGDGDDGGDDDDGGGYEPIAPGGTTGGGARDVLTYMRRSVKLPGSSRAAVHKAREAVAYLVANFVTQAPRAVVPHLTAIRDTCVACVKQEGASEAARAVLAPLNAIAAGRCMGAPAFRPAEVWATLVTELRATPSVYHKQNGPKGAAFATLGVIAAAYPAEFDADMLYRDGYLRMMAALRAQWHGDKVTAAEVLSAAGGDDAELEGDDDDEAPPRGATAAASGAADAATAARPALLAGAGGPAFQGHRHVPAP